MRNIFSKTLNQIKWGAIALSTIYASSASAAIISDSFDSSPSLSESQAPGVYYTDRYAPAGFDSELFEGDNRLALTLSSSDGASNRPSGFSGAFYNTQGRKYDVSGATAASIDMYIDSAFVSDPNRVGGLWGTAVEAGSAISAFPIIEFANGSFQIWDGAGFNNIGLPSGFLTDTFVNIGFELNVPANSIEYFLNGVSVFTDTNANSSVSLSNIIIQGYNTTAGVDRTLYFDNLLVTDASVANVSAPGTLAMLLLMITVVSVGNYKRRQNQR